MPEPDYEWIISRICEDFPAHTPETAGVAWENDPMLYVRIFELRAFRDAKSHVEGAKEWSDLKLSDSVKKYMQIEAQVMADRHRRIKEQLARGRA